MESSTSSKIFSKYSCTTVTIFAQENESDFTGFIKKISHDRAIIITCAHNILLTIEEENVTEVLTQLCGTFTNVIKKNSNRRRNVNVSLGILGMDISADIAILFTYLPSEIDKSKNIFSGFKFNKKNRVLKWGDSINFPRGNPVYCIGYSYGNGLDAYSGNCSNNNFVYDPENVNYPNLTNQFLTSLNVEAGSSGAAVLSGKGKIIGMIGWKKINNNYIGGPSEFTLKRIFNILLKLNPIKNIKGFYQGVNFDGKTGSGWLGLLSFSFLNSKNATILKNQYPELIGTEKILQAEGIVVNSFAEDGKYNIPKIPLNHLLNLNTKMEEPLMINDIILEVDGKKINYLFNNNIINASAYYDINARPILKVFRPSNQKYYTFQAKPVPFPLELEVVSSDDTIKLLSTSVQYSHIIASQDENNDKIAYLYFKKTINGVITNWVSTIFSDYFRPNASQFFSERRFYLKSTIYEKENTDLKWKHTCKYYGDANGKNSEIVTFNTSYNFQTY